MPRANTFSYKGSSTYSGGRWTGGRLYFLPFHSFSGAARLPMWDALRLVLGGTIAILGDGGAVASITTPDGDSLLLTGEPGPAEQGAASPNGFVPVPAHERAFDPSRIRIEDFRIEDFRIEGLRVDDIVAAQVIERIAKASGVLARTRREPARHRRGPRGGHRRLQDVIGDLDVGPRVTEREAPGPRKTVPAELVKLAFDRKPLIITDRDAAEPAVPRAEVVKDLSAFRSHLLALAAQLPESAERSAVVELAKEAEPLGAVAEKSFAGRIDKVIASEIGAIAKALYSDDFVLDTISVHGDGGRIAIAHSLREYIIHHDGRVGSTLRVAGSSLRTAANTLTVAPGAGRRVTLTVTNRLGLRGDIVRARFVDLPAEAAAPLTLNVRPGLGRWELAGDALAGPAQAQVSGVIGGRRFGARYDLPLERALRIQLPLAAESARLTVATTRGLFDDAIAVTKLSPR